MENNSFTKILSRFQGQQILVIGDFILDSFIKGRSNRLSPEAPVPVVDVESECYYCGGAANTALNLQRMGAHVVFISVTGHDANSTRGLKILAEAGIDTRFIIPDPSRTTLLKTRVMAGNQLLVRYDQGTCSAISSETEDLLAGYIEEALLQCKTLLIADYDKGLLTPGIIETLTKQTQTHKLFTAIDSKRLPEFRELQPMLVKPNYQEALVMLKEIDHINRVEQMRELAYMLFEVTGASHMALTLDATGVLLWQKQQDPIHLPSCSVLSPQVSGAGDTFIAACLLAMVAGSSFEMAGEIAMAAAAIAIGKEATASCSYQEIKDCFIQKNKQINDIGDLENLCLHYRRSGKKIVFTNGCFDILHSGHVRYLSGAKGLGDILIVGVNKDESISRLKGPSRPVNKLNDRIQVLAGLESVSHLIEFGSAENDTPSPLIALIKPDFFVKGGDYSLDKLPEARLVEENGGRVILLPYIEDHSTTLIISRISQNASLLPDL